MKLKFWAEPSALPELAEFSITAALLVAMLLFLGDTAVRHAVG
jgi:hypothetical protein